MANAQAGNFTRVVDIVDTVVAGIAEDTTIGTAGTGWSSSTTIARTALGGRVVFLELFLNRTGATITQTNTNVTDATVFTLDTAYRPSETVNAVCGNGSIVGEVAINTDGTVVLRAASYDVASGTNLRITTMFITAG